MIKEQTVLVLGAGASAPYGFPLGAELVEQICTRSRFLSDKEFVKQVEACGHTKDHIGDFIDELRIARPYSVDSFLETRKGFRAVGRAAVVSLLQRAEVMSDKNRVSDEDWYRYLFNKILLRTSADHFRSQARRLVIVTFNFDRSLEWMLFQSARSQFGFTDDATRDLVTELRIHHVHGTLGEPEWLWPKAANCTYYGDTDEEAAAKAIRSIKMVDDDIDEAVIEDVEAALRKAKHVYFLGFGFDERNLAKLRTPLSVSGATVRATADGFTTLELSPVKAHFNGAGGGIHLYQHARALTFLREHAEAFFG